MACTPTTTGVGGTEGSSTGEASSTGTLPPPGTSTAADTTAGSMGDSSGSSSEGSSSAGSSGTADSGSTGCTPGREEGCECDANDECGVALACRGGVCVPDDCGNTTIEPPEECDDGNAMNGDGCDNDCTVSSGAAQVVAGNEHVCAIFHTGQIKCWGNHDDGRLGYLGQAEDIGDDETPADVGFVDIGAPVDELALGSNFTCARTGGDVRCWGDSQHGRTGQGHQVDLGFAEVPSAIPPIALGADAVQISAGAEHACAVLSTQEVKCWGRNDHGQVGIPGLAAVGDDELPSAVPVINVGTNVLQVAAGLDHTCALLGGGDVRCWGNENAGQLGSPAIGEDIGDNEDPATVPMVMLNEEAVMIAAGADHTCVSYVTGDMQCWGGNGSGQLGYGDVVNVGDNEEVNTLPFLNFGSPPTSLAPGAAHTCLRVSMTWIWCWGEGDNGRLGYGDTLDQFAPLVNEVMVALPEGPRQVTAGEAFTCATTLDSDVKCWGRNNRGQLGYGAVWNQDLGDNEPIDAIGAVPME